jgi:hypothetical protein
MLAIVTTPIGAYSMRLSLLIIVFTASMIFMTACGTRYMSKTAVMNNPPDGKVLVNFHRPSGWSGGYEFNLWDGEHLIGFNSGKTLVQHVCEPGDHTFIARGQSVTVAKGSLLAGKVYDLVCNVRPGVFGATVVIDVVGKSDERRGELAEWMEDERTLRMTDENHREFEQGEVAEIRNIIQDFTTGEKSGRLHRINSDDHR